jgi:hypothetical protein
MSRLPHFNASTNTFVQLFVLVGFQVKYSNHLRVLQTKMYNDKQKVLRDKKQEPINESETECVPCE